jgi:membrane protein YdbS with pleckstrin-like domain
MLGSLFLVLSFLGLFSTIIAHANLRKLFYVNLIYSIFLLFVIPLGTIFAFLTFPSLWNARSSEYDVEEEINILKEKKKKKKFRLKLKSPNIPIRKNINKESDMVA